MMGYRTLEISSSCEIHIIEGQLEVTSDSGSILIPNRGFKSDNGSWSKYQTVNYGFINTKPE